MASVGEVKVPGIRFDLVDPTEPDALAALDRYFSELDARFVGGFEPGDTAIEDAPAFRNPRGGFMVARDHGRVVGCGAFTLVDSDRGEIKRMWIDAEVRGVGLGRRLLAELERRLARAGATTVVLDTNSVLAEAIAMYERNGYSPTERYNDNPYAQRWFTKRLTPAIRPLGPDDVASPTTFVTEQLRVGGDYLEAVTELLHRVRGRHPTAGLLEAADLQWWWRRPRTTDELGQLFWVDEYGHPEAAVIATDWGDTVALDPIFLPGATPEWIAEVIGRGVAHAGDAGFTALDVAIDRADHAMRQVLLGLDFSVMNDEFDAPSLEVVDAWMAALDRPAVSRLAEGYRLVSRLETRSGPHHLIERSGPEVEARLRQTSLYRADLDLVVLDPHDRVAAYGLFWFDPDTRVGLVEPMRTEDDHQRRGLARHVLTAGLELLAQAGAERLKICFQPDNVAARELYLGIGFEPGKSTEVLSRRTAR